MKLELPFWEKLSQAAAVEKEGWDQTIDRRRKRDKNKQTKTGTTTVSIKKKSAR